MPAGDVDPTFLPNGVDPDGNYLQPPVPDRVLADVARGLPVDLDALKTLRARADLAGVEHFGTIGDPNKLSEVGWGVLFADEDAARVADLVNALEPLLERRRAQAGALYYQLDGVRAFKAGETKNSFLTRFKLGPGPVNPKKLPYYLLIVGDPRRIPFRFQQLMDVQFAVGRLHFDGEDEPDVLAKYARYAKSVVDAEERAAQGTLAIPKRAVLFGARNDGDLPTMASVEQLVLPLASELQQDLADWSVTAEVNDEATRDTLGGLVGGATAPAFLFTASHGLGIERNDPRLLARQGSIVCSDWPGPGSAVDDAHVFSAGDVDAQASLTGRVAFHFACFGAGTPQRDDLSAAVGGAEIAPHDFIARLPQALLSHPGGGALAVVGHVDRSLGWSFLWEGAGAQRTVFRKAFGEIMKGRPLGFALDDFGARYAEIATLLADELADIKGGKTPDEKLLARYWTATSDARNYVVLGDPAVRLATV